MFAHHGAAGSAGGDDVVVVFEILDELFRKLAGAVLVSVVEERLAATGLYLWKANLASVVLQDPGDGDADVWIELIGQAGDEQRDVVRHRRVSLGRLQY